jgi:DNA-binding MarR family transcriptional regulator
MAMGYARAFPDKVSNLVLIASSPQGQRFIRRWTNLEKYGLIQRKNDVSHGRILCTELTSQGQDVVKKAHQMIRAVESRMLVTVSEEHKLLLEKLLLECFNNLQ